MALALLGGAAKAIGGSIVKNVAKDKAKSFISGKKKTVAPGAIKKGDDSSTPGKGGSALAVRPQASLVPSISPVSASEVSSESISSGDTLTLIKIKVFEIDKFLKGTLAQEKASAKKTKKSDEEQKRKKQESTLEKITPKPKGILKKITAPAKGLFDGIFNFISTIFLGRLLVVLLEKNPNLPGGSLLMFLANMAEKIIDIIIGTLDAFGSFLAFGQEKLDGAKSWLEEHRGDEAGKAFDELLGGLTNLFNAAVIVGSIFALGAGAGFKGKGRGRGKGGGSVKPQTRIRTKPQEAFQAGRPKGMQPPGTTSQRAAKRYAQRYGRNAAIKRFGKEAVDTLGNASRSGVTKLARKGVVGALGKGATKAGLKFVKNFISPLAKRIPLIGGLIDFALNFFVFKESLGKSAFKAIGAGVGGALGGALGSLVPGFGNIIGFVAGGSVGDWLGGLLYDLFFAGQKPVKITEEDGKPSKPASNPTAMPSVSTQGADLRNQTEGSKIAGELGKYLNREGLKWGSGVTEHPEHGGVKPVHTGGSYHYKEQGYRAIDIGGWGPNRFKQEGQTGTDDQTQIIAGIQKFNKDKGVKPIEFITEATDPTYHNDHVHIAYGLGGLVKGITHAMLGEKGEEFVIDNDSYTAIEGAFPGLLATINAAKGKSAIEAVMAYTDYEKPPEPEIAMMSGGSSGESGSYGDSGGESMVSPSVPEGSSGTNSSWKDIRYKFG